MLEITIRRLYIRDRPRYADSLCTRAEKARLVLANGFDPVIVSNADLGRVISKRHVIRPDA